MENDLRMLVAQRLSKASKTLACIKKGIHLRNNSINLHHYKTLLKLPFWSSILRNDLVELERVQRKTTKLIRGMENLRYDDHSL